ncbi:MAG: hypothetical protein CR981_04425 [Proteobacteria bacterium]|nr:MAG: hypothetical protein CR981_04425 [Pseudomonadota bacterium]
MDIICSACGRKHQLTARIANSLERLEPGKKLRLQCSHCQKPILCGPELLRSEAHLRKGRKKELPLVKPPEPPDISWLREGIFEEETVVSDIPQALVMVPAGKIQEQISHALTGLGYRPETAETVPEVMGKMQFFNYSSIVMHTSFDGYSLETNPFHAHMCEMNMSKRRYIFYVLIGSQFKTFYNLQAMACSANLVVNEKDCSHFSVILRKSIPEYEELFGPFMEELKVRGR